MESNFTVYRLGDIASFAYGKMPKKHLLGSGEYITYSGYRYIESYPEKNVSAGDVIVVARGVGGTGDVKLVSQDCYLTNLSIKISLNKQHLLNEYFYYLFKQNNLRYLDSGSAQSQITIADLCNIVLHVPSTDYQQCVINHLKKIDDKISLNHQINQTLEKMAQILFKSWFVDFDPVIDNALDAGFFELDLAFPDELLRRADARRAVRERSDFKPLPDATRQLFPAAFEECAEPSLGLGGWVPKGWVAATFSDLADVVMGQSPKGDAYNSNGIGTPLINGPVEFGEYHPVKSKWTTSTTKMSEKNDLIVCVRGSTTGRYVMSDGEYCLGRGVCAVRGGLIQPFIIYQFKSNITTLLGLATGSTFPSWSGPLLKKHIVLKPSAGPIKKFCAITGSNLKKMGDLDVENLALSELRETLLPKLISGELSLDKIEAEFVKEGVA